MPMPKDFADEKYQTKYRQPLINHIAKLLPIVFWFTVNSSIARADSVSVAELLEMSIEDLMNIEVVSASRRSQPIEEAPVAIDAISAEDIKASGATNIWDLLRFRTGMDVIDARAGDGNRGIVSVRGFPREYVNNLQVMVDGRSVLSSYGGGVYWPQLPVQINDIERIEIVRGPNAALFGSNSGLGIIQIFTKKPKSNSVQAWVDSGNNDTSRASVAVERIGMASGYRVSALYQDEQGFVTPSGETEQDQIRSRKFNLRGYYQTSIDSTVEYYTGGSWDDNTIPRGNEGDFRNVFGMVKYFQHLEEGASIDVSMAYSDANHRIIPVSSTLNWGTIDYYQADFNLVHRFNWTAYDVETVWGIDYRYANVDADIVFENKPSQRNRIARAFIHQAVDITERTTLVGAVSLENSDTGGDQPAYQAVAMHRLNDRHTLRASYSFAPTLPNLYEKGVNHQPSGFARIIGNPDLEPEKLQSLEFGYTGNFLDKHLQFKSNLFYMDIDDVSASYSEDNDNPPPYILVKFRNGNNAVARGLEAELKYIMPKHYSVYLNYTFEKITDDIDDIMVVDATPKHKINTGGTYHFSHKQTLSLNANYKSSYKTIPANRSPFYIRDISSYVRLDLRYSYRYSDNLEFSFSGHNLLEKTHQEFSDFENLEVSRLVYGRTEFRF